MALIPARADLPWLQRRISRGVRGSSTPTSPPSSLPQFPCLFPWCGEHPCTQSPTTLTELSSLLSQAQSRPHSTGQMPSSHLDPQSVLGRGQAPFLLQGTSLGQLLGMGAAGGTSC